MHGLTDSITTQPWVDIFTTWYVLVDDAYTALVAQVGRLRQRGPAPRFGDSEVLTIALIAETFFHGNEEVCLSFIRQAPSRSVSTPCRRYALQSATAGTGGND